MNMGISLVFLNVHNTGGGYSGKWMGMDHPSSSSSWRWYAPAENSCVAGVGATVSQSEAPVHPSIHH